MATTSSTSSSTSTVSNGRYWGLASGLDVDSIVTSLVSGQQTKIDKVQQSQQKLEWKQSAYRDIASKLDTFESAYLQLGASTSMASSDMYTSYSTSSDNSALTATATSDASGTPQKVVITQSATAASLIGNKVSGSITGTIDLADALVTLKTDAATAALAGADDPSLSITVDDVKKTISFSSDDLKSVSDAAGLKDLINTKLQTAFGTTAKVTASLDSDNQLKLSTPSGYDSTTISVATSNSSYDALDDLGLKSGTGNRLDTSATLDSLLGTTSTGDITVNINGTDVTLGTGSTTLADAFAAINSSDAGVTIAYDKTGDTVSMTSTQSGASGSVDLTGESSDFFTNLGITTTKATGQDAILSINGTSYTRASNGFTISGVTYKINSSVSSSSPVTANLTFNQDTATLKTGLQAFISSYNTLIEAIHTQINTAPDKDYAPLTDTQKAQMTSTQVDSWNAKANQGMLFNDDALESLADNMRSVLYKSVTLSDNSKFSLYDLGITTSDTASDYGKLEIKSTDETKFATALASSASKIKELFTKSSRTVLDIAPKTATALADQKQRTADEGLANRLDDLVKGAIGSSSGTYGTIVLLAGTTDLNTYSNTIYKQLKEMATNIADLKTQLTTKKNSLYTKFQNLETYMSKANSQSSIVSSALGSSS